MAGRLGRNVVHFANLPIRLLSGSHPQPSRTSKKSEYSSHSTTSTSTRVRTLNMEGRKRKRGGLLIAKPDYKKAYVTLGIPLFVSPHIFPLKALADEKERMNKQKKSSFVEEDGGDGKRRLTKIRRRGLASQAVGPAAAVTWRLRRLSLE
ncbi:hypothetical protein K2173_014734 [Erythroxylum novogranatense]|uniref:Large ribosomal subunit protein uL23m n=1 Tax=Erythroxylum novogranatense TaxID=1862640 RepID=A0AAV8TFG5_9ROSI|nr:hypothetical protein K2173_014734 [Erythroxylum novogranatense]